MFYILSGLTDHGAIIQWDTGPGIYSVLSYLLWPLYQHQVNTMFLFVIVICGNYMVQTNHSFNTCNVFS